jgi:hypothetical protein
MADEKLIKVHRGENGGGVTKSVKPKDLAKNKAAGFVLVVDAPAKPAAKPKADKTE